jgi:hypothetical protein
MMGQSQQCSQKRKTPEFAKEAMESGSLKNSLLLARASIKTTCRTAGGIESIFESNVEKPILLSVRERYPCTGVAGIYAMRPRK